MAIHGQIHVIQIANRFYEIYNIDKEFKTSFVIWHSGEQLCTCSMDDNNEWASEPTISEELFTEILQRIKLLHQ
jgi:hypothetical protein